MKTKWQNVRKFAKILTDRTHEMNAHRYKESRISADFNVGNLVFVKDEARTVGTTHELESKSRGPYRVLAVRDVVNYVPQQVNKSKRSQHTDDFHVSKLKQYREYNKEVQESLLD